MQSYKKSTLETAKFNDSDLPTATKTNYIETSPYLNTPSLKSPSRVHAKMQEVRESIGSMINEMSHKKNQNNQAIERVKNVNADAMAMLGGAGEYSTYTPKKSDRPYNPRENRTIGGLPGYEYHNNQYEPGMGFSTEFNLHDDNDNNSAPQFKSLEQENFELRKALSEQISMNNDLLKRIHFLQCENNDLKVQLGYPDAKLRSTRYASVNYDDHNNDFSQGQRYGAASGKFGGVVDNPNIRSSLNIPQNYGNNTNFHNSGNRQGGYGQSGSNFGVNRSLNYEYHNNHSSLYSDLEELKRQNEALRQNTIALLQRN